MNGSFGMDWFCISHGLWIAEVLPIYGFQSENYDDWNVGIVKQTLENFLSLV